MKLYTYIKVRMVFCILNCILKGHSINFPKKYCISFPEDKFCHSKQCRPLNDTLSGISSGSSLFSKVPILGVSCLKGLSSTGWVVPLKMINSLKFWQ